MWSARATAWTCRPARDGAPSAKAREEERSRRRSGKEAAEPGDSVPKSSGKAVYVLESNRRWEIFPKKETRSLPREDPFSPLYREGKLCQILGGLPAPPRLVYKNRGEEALESPAQPQGWAVAKPHCRLNSVVLPVS